MALLVTAQHFASVSILIWSNLGLWEKNMFVNKEKEPQLIGMFKADDPELRSVVKMVENLNKDLTDSGFDRYQYQVVRRGIKTYIEQKGA
jgi:hypothetical protein